MSEISLRGDEATASVAFLGAELRAWRVGDHPLMWTPDPSIWDGTAPILFPVVGWTRGGRVRIRDETFPLGLHGFARALPFVVAERAADRVRLRLRSSPETGLLYPFAFTLDVTYRLAGAALRTELAVRNLGSTAMPYACGLHPGFRWPFAGGGAEEYAIHFDAPERPEVPLISADGLFTRERRPVPLRGRRLDLSDALLAREALCFLEARSRGLRFARRGGAVIAMELEGFPHLALWSRPGGRFLSIEAWTGHGDTVDSDGDLLRKPSMIHLPPGARGVHAATYTFVPTAEPVTQDGRRD